MGQRRMKVLCALRIGMRMLSLQTTLAQSSHPASGVTGAAPKPKSQINWQHGAKVVYHLNRMKFLTAYCPYDASSEERRSLPCRFYELQKDFSKAKPEEKIELVARRSTMFDQFESRSDAAKKEEKERDSALYTKAYAKYCTEEHIAQPVCTSESNKKLVRQSRLEQAYQEFAFGGARPSVPFARTARSMAPAALPRRRTSRLRLRGGHRSRNCRPHRHPSRRGRRSRHRRAHHHRQSP